MPHYLPCDFEIDTKTRTVTHKASVENIHGIALQRWATRPTTITTRRGIRTFRSEIAVILSVTRSKHFERKSARRDRHHRRARGANPETTLSYISGRSGTARLRIVGAASRLA